MCLEESNQDNKRQNSGGRTSKKLGGQERRLGSLQKRGPLCGPEVISKGCQVDNEIQFVTDVPEDRRRCNDLKALPRIPL